MSPGRPVLSTERLHLRELNHGDLDFVAAMLADPEVMRHYPKVLARDESLAWIDRQRERYDRHGHGLWLVVRRDDGLPVGQVGLLTQEVDGEEIPEVGYLLSRWAWGRGFATEAARGVVAHAFESLGAPRVHSLIREANAPSRAVAERLGMRVLREVDFRGLPHLLHGVDRPRVAG